MLHSQKAESKHTEDAALIAWLWDSSLGSVFILIHISTGILEGFLVAPSPEKT